MRSPCPNMVPGIQNDVATATAAISTVPARPATTVSTKDMAICAICPRKTGTARKTRLRASCLLKCLNMMAPPGGRGGLAGKRSRTGFPVSNLIPFSGYGLKGDALGCGPKARQATPKTRSAAPNKKRPNIRQGGDLRRQGRFFRNMLRRRPSANKGRTARRKPSSGKTTRGAALSRERSEPCAMRRFRASPASKAGRDAAEPAAGKTLCSKRSAL